MTMLKESTLGVLAVLLVAFLGLPGCTAGREATPPATPGVSAPASAGASPPAGAQATSPALAEQIYRDAVSKVRARDTRGQDASRNGYSDLKDCLQRETPAGVKAPYLALAEWSYPASGKKDTDILVAYGPNAAKVQAAVKRFETVLPTLDRALGKPDFTWPSEWDKGPAARVPNFIQMRAMVQNLVGYAEYCAVTGKPARALHYLLGTIEFGARVAQNSILISCMIGIALDSIGLEATFTFLGRSPALTAKDYRAALARLAALPLTPATLLDRMDEEHAFQVTVVDLMIRDPRAAEGLPLPKDPATLKQERKVLADLYLLQRPSIEKLHAPSEDGIDMDRAVKESHSTVAAALVPAAGKAITHFRHVLTKIGGLKLLCALQVHKLEKGSYPETLDQLVPGELEALPRNYVSPDGKFSYQKTGNDFQLSSAVAPALQEVLSTRAYSYRPPEPRK